MSSHTEDTITTILANELEKKDVKVQIFPKIELPGIGIRKPDIWCHNGGDYVIEAKFHKNKLYEAIAKLYEYLTLPSVVGGFAILSPEELSLPGLRYCQVGITSSPPALMMLCIIAIAVTNSFTHINFFEFTLL
jgi:hypothetical protein